MVAHLEERDSEVEKLLSDVEPVLSNADVGKEAIGQRVATENISLDLSTVTPRAGLLTCLHDPVGARRSRVSISA